MQRRILPVLAGLSWLLATQVLAQEVPKSFSMIEANGHQGFIRALAFTPDGSQLISAGNDKTIRVWDWRRSTIARSIRGEAGPGAEGKVFAMALSPDGRWLVAAGWMDFVSKEADHARVFDFATGKLVSLLKGHKDVIHSVAFSPDGRLLATASSDKTAMIWDLSNPAAPRRLQRLEGHSGSITAVIFAKDGSRVITGSDDKTVRLWRASNGRPDAVLEGHTNGVLGLAVSPADGTIASSSGNGEIYLWNAETGQRVRRLAKIEGSIGALAFLPDGQGLVAACSTNCDAGQVIWDVKTGEKRRVYSRHNNTVKGLAISPDGRTIATAGGENNEIHVWDPAKGDDGEVKELVGLGAAILTVAFTPDGRSIAWGNKRDYKTHADRGPLQFFMALPTAGENPAKPQRLSAEEADRMVRTAHQHGSTSLSHERGGALGREDGVLLIKKAGAQPIKLARDTSNGIRHLAYAMSPDGRRVISAGAGGWTFAYDPQGKVLCQYIGHDSDVWSVVPSVDGRYLVSGSDDQTVRLWNLTSCELLVSFFQANNGEWIAWTPQGFYSGSAKAGSLFGWQLNRGPEREATFVAAETLRELHRPDIIEKAIALASAAAAVRQAFPSGFELAALLERAAR